MTVLQPLAAATIKLDLIFASRLTHSISSRMAPIHRCLLAFVVLVFIGDFSFLKLLLLLLNRCELSEAQVYHKLV